MTKKEYIDFIRNTLPAEDKTDKFHPANVDAAINFAVNTVFYEMYKQNPKVMAKSLERYSHALTSLTVTAALGAVYPRYTSTLEFDIIDLPRKAGSILEILQKTAAGEALNTTTAYVPVSALEARQFYGSEASLPGNVIGFSWFAGRTIEYWGMDAANAALGVYARVIKQFKDYGLTDNIVLPYGQDERIIELVRQYLGAIPPKDLVNDNADLRQ